MDIILTLVFCFLTCSIQHAECVGFHLPAPESFTHSCTSLGSWSVTGNVTITAVDMEVYTTNITLKINNRNLCNIDLDACPESSSTSNIRVGRSSPNVCQCVSRLSEDDYTIYVRQEIAPADVGAMLTIIVPGQEQYGPLQATHDVGRIPRKTDGNMTYQINSGLPTQLASEQNFTACKGQPLWIKVCAPDAHKGTVLKITELQQTTTSSNPCIHIIEAFTFQDTDSYPVVFTYDEGAGCPFQENFIIHVQQQMNGCLSTANPTAATTSASAMTSSAPTPAPTTAPHLPCPETPTSPPLQQVTLYNGIKVLCDTWTKGGNWVIIQRRTKGNVDFYRAWADYVAGFGNLDGDHWMGLQDIHDLCPPSKPCSLRIHLKDDNLHGSSVTEWAEYSNFSLGGFTEHYRLSISGFDNSSTINNTINENNGMPFSTYDRDNDLDTTSNCAAVWVGAWWFKSCSYSDLNGKWGDGLYWKNSKDKDIHATFSEMKIRLHP